MTLVDLISQTYILWYEKGPTRSKEMDPVANSEF